MRPVILISGESEKAPPSSVFTNSRRTYSIDGYIKSVLDAGGLPVIAPVLLSPSLIDAYLNLADLVILQGGEDVDPSLYGEKREEACKETDINQDRTQILLIRKARARGIPVFGICRGLQLINVALNGTLFQDIPNHMDKERVAEPVHSVAISGFLKEVFNTPTIEVNSLHHQAIKNLAEGLSVCALSEDGIIEAAASRDGLLYGVQFHPEVLETTKKLWNFIIRTAAPDRAAL